MKAFSSVAAALLLTGLTAGHAAPKHPFILWTPAEAASIRERVEREAWARATWERLDKQGKYDGFGRLFAYSVMQDAAAGEAIKKDLLSFVNARVDSRPWSSMTMSALLYDVLYDALTPEERAALEKTFRTHIEHELTKDDRNYQKVNWLPNMQWPRKMGAMLMAVAMRDEQLIKGLFEGNGGWKYYFDEYVSDGYFYNEEFGKQYSTMGNMLLWCRGLERLGLDAYGYGYVGKDGATMQRYLYSYILQGLPRYDLGHDRYHYPRVTMGDARGARGSEAYGGQHSIVTGPIAGSREGEPAWMGSNMNGRDHHNRIVRKMLAPNWFEIAHAKWPDAGFDYFLAEMRPFDADRYYPHLYWGLDPIDPGTVTPPPIESGSWPVRGFSVLRAEPGSDFWESAAPALGIRWASRYAHRVHDVFSLLQFVAFNKPLYVNRQVAGGYAGTDAGWSESIRSHSSVMVDYQEPRCVGPIPLRASFGDLAQFNAGTARGVYDDVTQTRALVLTREYLFDVFQLESPRPRQYLWTLQGLGHACPHRPEDWVASQNLVSAIPALADEKSRVAGSDDWGITLYQVSGGVDPRYSSYGKRWFENQVGVQVRMLGAPTTIAYTGWGPALPGDMHRLRHGNPEPGGRVVAASRGCASTAFVALHEPYQNVPRLHTFESLEQSRSAVAVRIAGRDVNDRVAVAWSKTNEPQLLAGDGEALHFTGYALLRASGNEWLAEGSLKGFRVHAPGTSVPRLILDGKKHATRRRGDFIVWGDIPGQPEGTPRPPEPKALVAARWLQDTLQLATGGQGHVALELRNMGPTPVSGTIRVMTSAGLSANVQELVVTELACGAQRRLEFTVQADPAFANTLGSIRLESSGPFQPLDLRVSQGMVLRHAQRWPGRPGTSLWGPRYRATYYKNDSVAAAHMLDPDGELRSPFRRFSSSRSPRLFRQDSARKGQLSRRETRVPGYGYWAAGMRDGRDGAPRTAVASGTHPHTSADAMLQYRWTEDWILASVRAIPGNEVYRLDWFITPPRGDKARVPPDQQTLVMVHDGETLHTIDAESNARPDIEAGAHVRAAFRRPRGFRYGEAQFYPDGARFDKIDRKHATPVVMLTGNRQTAFTYCLASEFAALVEKWTTTGPSAKPSVWGQGDTNK